MSKPTEEQVADAGAMIQSHFRQYGNAATESRLASLVYSIHATLTGDGKPAADHADALELARQARKPVVEETPVDPAATEPAATVATDRGGNPLPEAPDAQDDDETDEEFYSMEELQAMTVASLRELAEEGEVNLTGAGNKEQIIAAILASE